jgi:RNA polymerase sigma factor (sigma-70 family)
MAGLARGVEEYLAMSAASPGPAPEDEAALAELLEAYLATLSGPDLAIFQLWHCTGQNQGEVADRLGVSDSTISRRLDEMRARLLALLTGHRTD